MARDAAGETHLKVRVRAAPENGKANAALVEVLADALRVPKSAVRLVRGQTARLKVVNIDGLDAAEAARRCPLLKVEG